MEILLSDFCDDVHGSRRRMQRLRGARSDSPPLAGFLVEVTDITATSATVAVTPEDPTVWYHFAAGARTEYEQHGNNPQDYAEYYLNTLRQRHPDEPFADLLDANRTQGKGNRPYTDLTPETDYIAFAVAVTEEGLCPWEGVSKAFRTPASDPVQKVDCTFEIEVTDLTTMSATACVTPSDDEVPYYYEMVSRTIFEEEMGGTDEGLTAYLQQMLEDNCQAIGVGIAEIIEFMCVCGPDSYTDSYLDPDSDYLVWCVGLDMQGRLITDIAKKEFRTLAVQPSDITFTITADQITGSGAQITCTPSNNDYYFFDLWATADLEGLNDEELVAMIEAFYDENGGMNGHIGRGPVVLDGEGMLEADTGYTALAFGYDAYTCNSDIARMTFRTLPAGAAADCTFEITVDPLRPISGTVHIRPSDSAIYYYYDLILTSEDTTDAALVEKVIALLRAKAESEGISFEEAVRQARKRGRTSADARLDPQTSFTVFAYAIDPDGTAAGPVTRYAFSTPEQYVSAATVTVTAEKYYDGDALYAADPVLYGDLQGAAFIPTTASPSADAVHWYVGLFIDEGLEDEVMFPDELIITNLVDQKKGMADLRQMEFVTEWGNPTFLAVAEDATGNYGRVIRMPYPVVKEGVSPVDDLIGVSPLGVRTSSRGVAFSSVSERGGLLRMRDFVPQRIEPALRRIVPSSRIAPGRAVCPTCEAAPAAARHRAPHRRVATPAV